MSTAAEWEAGLLKLLVKSYADGQVSARFAKLHQCTEYGGPREEQNCWVLVSKPALTLQLPGLTETEAIESGSGNDAMPMVSHVAIVVGGTGVAPALQILRELVDDSDDGAFAGIDCSATLLYSSRTALDVLCIDVRTVQVMYAARFTFMAFQSNANECAADFNLPRDQSRAAIDFGNLRMTVVLHVRMYVQELREVEAAAEACGRRIVVRHTLTDMPSTDGRSAPAPAAAAGTSGNRVEREPQRAVRAARVLPTDPQWIPGRHYHFVSRWSPYKPQSGTLRTAVGDEEAGLRGHIDEAMLAANLPAPGPGVHVVVCGPPAMWDDMRRFLLCIGHHESNLIELKALSDAQVRERLVLQQAEGEARPTSD